MTTIDENKDIITNVMNDILDYINSKKFDKFIKKSIKVAKHHTDKPTLGWGNSQKFAFNRAKKEFVLIPEEYNPDLFFSFDLLEGFDSGLEYIDFIDERDDSFIREIFVQSVKMHMTSLTDH